MSSICLLLLAGVLATACSHSFTQEGGDTESARREVNIPVVEAVQARSGSLPLSERLTGNVIAQNQVALYPEISGQVVRVEARDGDLVRRGDPLVFLDDSQYREQLQQAQANYRVNQAALRQAQARYEELEVQFKRTKMLADEGLSSQLEVETLAAQLASARANIELVEAQIEEAESAIEEAKMILSRSVIRAPITGTIGRRNAEVGMQVNPNTELFTIGDLGRLRIEVILTDEILEAVEVGQPARVYVRSRASAPRILEAKVSRISPFLDPVTRSTEAEIDLQNGGNILRPGMSVTVEILYGESRQATLVPTSAIYTQPDTGEEGVYILGSLEPEMALSGNGASNRPPPLSPPKPVRFDPVEIIAEGRMEVAVEGVKPGTWVVAVGQDLLSQGAQQARARPSSWERILRLQTLQREDLLQEVLESEME